MIRKLGIGSVSLERDQKRDCLARRLGVDLDPYKERWETNGDLVMEINFKVY